MRKTKTQQFAEAWYAVMRDEQMYEFELFRDKYHGKEFDGEIRWIDAMYGEGIARIDGYSFRLHFSTIESVDKNGYTWPTESDRARLDTLGYNVPAKLTPYVSWGSGLMIEKCVVKSWT